MTKQNDDPANHSLKDSNIDTRCHYRRHLKAAQLSVYEYALGMSRTTGEFYASVARVCIETGYCRDTVSRAIAALRTAGWFHLLRGNKALVRQGGRFQTNVYAVVSHDDRASEHPTACDVPPRSKENPSRKNPVTEESDIPVTEKSRHGKTQSQSSNRTSR